MVERLNIGWDLKRNFARINYRLHTDAVKEHLIPEKISVKSAHYIFTSEADLLNKALFGYIAQEWKNANAEKKGNMRDYATAAQLVCLSNLESLNAEFIRQKLSPADRLFKLNEIAIIQMRSLLEAPRVKKIDSSFPTPKE